MMTLEITLTPTLEKQLVREAQRLGKSPAEVAFEQLNLKNAKLGRPRAPRSDAVKRLRAALSLTKTEMGVLLGISPTAISQMESTSTLPTKASPLKVLRRLAKRHGISLKEGATPSGCA